MAHESVEQIEGFLRQVVFDGRVAVPTVVVQNLELTADIAPLLLEFDQLARQQYPNNFPEFELESATYGALTLFHACQLLVYRELGNEAIAALLPIPPANANPASHASVDLLLRFLPDVVRLAKSASTSDLLVTRLLEIGQRWPLSSVGIAGLTELDVTALKKNTAVWRLYLDRILERNDTSRLSDEDVREGIRESLGAFPELAKSLHRACQI